VVVLLSAALAAAAGCEGGGGTDTASDEASGETPPGEDGGRDVDGGGLEADDGGREVDVGAADADDGGLDGEEARDGEDAPSPDGDGGDTRPDVDDVPADACGGVDCSGLDGRCVVGTCDPATGRCRAVPRPDGTPCDDGETCTTVDVCEGGACRGMRRGDTCELPLDIPESQGIFAFSGDTECAENDYRLSCGRTAFGTLPDVVYRMDFAQSRRVVVHVDRGTRETIELRGADCAAGEALACDWDGGAPLTEVAWLSATLDAGPHHLLLKTEDPGTYEMTVEIDPEDDCDGPILLGDLATSVGVGTGDGPDTTGAGDDFSASCGGAGAPDEFYAFELSERSLVRFEMWSWGAALGMTVVRGACATGPAGAAEVFCRTGLPLKEDRLLDPGDYFLVVDGAGPGDAGAYSLSLRRIWGHVALIGHDFSARNASVDELLVNAVQLSNDYDPIDVLEFVQYADASAGGEAANARAAIEATLSPPFLRTARFATLSDASALAASLDGIDVLLVHEQEARPDTGTLDAIGTAWAPILASFIDRGGVVIVLDSAAAETWRVLVPGGFVPGLGAGADVTGARLNVVDRDDALGLRVATPYTAPDSSTTFAVGCGTSVVQDPRTGDTIVLHRALP
jgi:hypothetical protein